MGIYNHSLIQRAIADLRIHQNGLDATLSIKRNRTTIYLNIYSPAGLTFDIKKVKPIFLLFGKSCIFENREYIEIKKKQKLCGKSVALSVIHLSFENRQGFGKKIEKKYSRSRKKQKSFGYIKV